MVRVGISSRDTVPAAVVHLAEAAVVRELHDALGDPGFTDWRPPSPAVVEIPDDVERLSVEPAALRRADRCEPVDLSDAQDFVKGLSDEELAYIVLGQYAETADK